MPTMNVHSQSLGASSFVSSYADSTPDTYQDHHMAQHPSASLSIGRDAYSNLDTSISSGKIFLLNSVTYNIGAMTGLEQSGTYSMRARIWKGNLNVQNFYESIATSSAVSVSGLSDYIFSFSPVYLGDGDYRFGIWVDSTANDRGFRWGMASANSSTYVYRPNYTTSSTSTLDKEPAAAQFTSWGSVAAYCVIDYDLPPLAPSISLTFNSTGTVTANFSVSDSNNGGSPITGYIWRYRVSGSSSWSIVPTQTTGSTVTFQGIFGTTYEVQAAAQNAVTTSYSSTGHGNIRSQSITLIRDTFDVGSGSFDTAVVNEAGYKQEYTASSGGFEFLIKPEWVDPNGPDSPSLAVVNPPPGISVSSQSTTNLTVTVSGKPTAVGKHRLRITMSGTNQVTKYGYWTLQIVPNIKVFDGQNWVTAKFIKVFDGQNWVDPTSLKVFNNISWVDPG